MRPRKKADFRIGNSMGVYFSGTSFACGFPCGFPLKPPKKGCSLKKETHPNMAMGQNSVPPPNIPIPSKISSWGGEFTELPPNWDPIRFWSPPPIYEAEPAKLEPNCASEALKLEPRLVSAHRSAKSMRDSSWTTNEPFRAFKAARFLGGPWNGSHAMFFKTLAVKWIWIST